MTTQFRPNITRIKGLSERRRMPLLGKIRLGIKKKSAKTGNEYPAETDYFVCPPEVRRVFGDKPKSLRIMVPINDIDSVFPVAYCFYGSSRGIKCKGDGETAWFVNDSGEMETKPCPCELLEQKKCKQVGRFLFMIPEVSIAGVYQLTTSSYNSIVDIQSGLDYVAALIGRFDLIELELKREPTETHYDGKKQVHYTCKVTLPHGFNTLALAQMRQKEGGVFTPQTLALPEPNEDNPIYDAPDMIVDEEDEPDEPEQEQEEPPKPKKTSSDIELDKINNDLVACKTVAEVESLWRKEYRKKIKEGHPKYKQVISMFSLRKKELTTACNNPLCDLNKGGMCSEGFTEGDDRCKAYTGS